MKFIMLQDILPHKHAPNFSDGRCFRVLIGYIRFPGLPHKGIESGALLGFAHFHGRMLREGEVTVSNSFSGTLIGEAFS